MKKFALLGGTGRVGTRITDEAARRGFSVEKFSRNGDIRLDANDREQVAKSLRGFDVVVSATNFRTLNAELLLTGLKEAGVKRLVMVGGAGTLNAGAGMLMDSPKFPAAALEEARAGRDVLARLRAETALDWTFVSPSAVLAPGERRGVYRSGKDDLLVDQSGASSISMEDLAVAILDELESPKHSRERFTVGY